MPAKKMRLALFVASCVLLLSGIACRSQTAGPWEWGPHLGAIGEDVVAISWKTSRPVSIDLHYGTAQMYDATGAWEETLTFDRHDGLAEIWLRDLLPGTLYRYQLIAYEGDAIYPSKVGAFRTTSAETRSFAFIVYGGTSSFPDRHKLVAGTIARDEAAGAVTVHAGDLVESPTEARFDNFLWAIGDLARSHPYATVVDDHGSDNSLYFEYFALPPGGGQSDEQWWSFDNGGVHFIGLDASLNDADGDAATAEQLAWLRQDLAAAEGRFIVVFSGRPLYSSSYESGRNEPLCSLWEPLFVPHGVDIVFSGTPHCYEHLLVNGIHYICTGGGGAPLSPSPAATAPGAVFRRYGLLHYIRVTIADDAMRVEAIPVATVYDDNVILVPTGRSIDTLVLRVAD